MVFLIFLVIISYHTLAPAGSYGILLSYTHLNSARVKKANRSLAEVIDVSLPGYQSLSNDEGHSTPQFREPLLQDMSYGGTSW